jgi:hypothetical protein
VLIDLPGGLLGQGSLDEGREGVVSETAHFPFSL